MNIKHLALFLFAVNASASAIAQTKTFSVVGDKLEYRNLATIESEADFETFTGRTTKVSGTIQFDPVKKTGSGTLTVDAASIDTGIPLRNEHMQSDQWLDTKRYPTISFKTSSVKSKGNDRYTVTGNITLHGVTKKVTTEAFVRYRAQSAATAAAGFEGDVLQITTSFKIKLSDFGIKVPSKIAGKVANDVAISVKAYALSK